MFLRILLVSSAALTLLAQPGPTDRPLPARMARAGEQAAFMARHLKLSEAQKSRVQEIQQKGRPEIQAKQERVRESRIAFQAALRRPDSPVEQLRQLHQTVADRQLEVMLAQRAVRLEVRTVLTPEQRAEADRMQALGEERRQFRAERMKKAMDGRMGRRAPGGGGRWGMGQE